MDFSKIELHPDKSGSLYKELAVQLESRIERAELIPGDKLPSGFATLKRGENSKGR